MQKIDRLGWAAGVCLKAYGWRIGIRVNKPEALDRVMACLPPGWEPSEPPFVDYLYSLRIGGTRAHVRSYHLLHSALRLAARTMDLDQAYEVLEGDLQLFLAEHARDRVFVHAGVVGWRGRALLVPGRSHSGKSKLVAALLRAGATYYSDEYAVLDEHGLVHPYPRQLVIREGHDQLGRRHAPEEFGGRTDATPLPVGLVALARYRPGARWQPRALSRGQALLEMLNHTVPARSRPEAAMTALAGMLPAAAAVKSLRGDATDTAVALLESLEN